MKRFEKGDAIKDLRKCRKTENFEAVRIDERFVIVIDDIQGGSMFGNAGDYLVREATGDLYVCSAESFERRYEWAEPEPEPEPEPEQTPEEHLRSIQAMFVEFGMREPEFVPCEDAPAPPEYSARLEFRVDENLLYRITCYALQKGGLHTIVTYSSGTLFEGYSRVRSFAAVQNHLAWHAIAVQDALGQRGRHVRPVRGTVELDPSLLSADYGRAPSPSAAKLREELEGRNDD